MKCKEYIITGAHKEYEYSKTYSVFYAFGCLSYSMNIWLAHNKHQLSHIYPWLICLYFLFQQYGHFFPDPQYMHVQHINCCDSFATYSYDFEFEKDSQFSR